MKVYLISLGCPKNLTDTEVLMGKLVAAGYEITTKPAQADMIIVNTCAFLKTARDEAIQTIKKMAQWKKKGKCKQLFIAGCLPKWKKQDRFSLSPWERELEGEGFETLVDGIVDSIGLFNYCTPRIKATPPWYAYVKIAEGCNNYCSYCLIPSIRGKLKFRKVNDILAEVKGLAKRGVKEILYIAQDTTAYPKLAQLLSKTAKIDGVHWIRLLYTHPLHLTNQVLKVIAKEPKIVKYLDLPIQHASDKILRLMNRRYTRHFLETLITKIRRQIPKIALRTTVIAGFPGEGETEFRELLDFIRWAKFDRLGCFAYQRETGTPAGKMRGQVSAKVKIKRVQQVMGVQARVARELNNKLIGQTLEILIEKAAGGVYIGRSYMDAPEIDGQVLVNSKKSLSPGEFVKVRIKKARAYDLFGSTA
ncbi:MAG: 30S ribosomal protein S12 methylthiotransferase RimO [Candidatus Margulisbacteria bacterium]|nr:30S ribosomal protein S12 methylthiotransferase RimO [Candidatus Margulisiibacteriota bacterium]